MIVNINESVSFESINEAEVLTEGITKSKFAPKEMGNDAIKIIEKIESKLANAPVNRGIWSKDKKFGDEKSFIKSVEKSKKKANSGDNKVKVNLNILYLSIKGKYSNPQNLANEVAAIIRAQGYKDNPDAKGFLKAVFGPGPMLYKKIDDKNIIICKMNVGFVTQYGVPTAYNNISIEFIAAVPDEKTMKYLNMNESAGIFDSVKFI